MRYAKNLVWLMLLFLSVTSFADSTQKLVELLAPIKNMKADFTQVLSTEKGKILQRSDGRMALARPGEFRWSIIRPNKQLIIADGRYLWIYDVALEQASRRKLSDYHGASPAALLSGSTKRLKEQFVIRRLGRSGIWFQLKPKADNSAFLWVELQFSAKQLKTMRFADNLGQISTIQFRNVQTNLPLPLGLFQFRPPKGVDVVKER